MKVRFGNTFLHITAIGMLTLTLFTDSLIYPLILGFCIGNLILNSREAQNEEL
jgi:hypothetical protein